MCPGFVRTPLVEKQIGDQAARTGCRRSACSRTSSSQPHAVKRLIEPAEVAGVVAFLLGPDGRAFTGAPVTMDLGVDGALSARHRDYFLSSSRPVLT